MPRFTTVKPTRSHMYNTWYHNYLPPTTLCIQVLMVMYCLVPTTILLENTTWLSLLRMSVSDRQQMCKHLSLQKNWVSAVYFNNWKLKIKLLLEVFPIHVSDVSCTVRQTIINNVVECQANNEILSSVCIIDVNGNAFNCCKFDDAMKL